MRLPLSSRLRSVSGLDISTGMLGRARTKHPGFRFQQGDIERPFPRAYGGTADVVVSLFGSLSHCDLAAARDRVLGLLRPGGRYFFMFLGPGHARRKVVKSEGAERLYPYDAKQIKLAYPGAKVWGLSGLIDTLPAWVPPPLRDLALGVESLTTGHVAPDACYFIVVEGTP